ncbi:MAG: hypothetical protein F4Y77_05550 [Holophagales bacterium]|nr:hypothetical protein [Holophagales bacterium]
MKKTLACLLGSLTLLALVAPASGSSAFAEMETELEAAWLGGGSLSAGEMADLLGSGWSRRQAFGCTVGAAILVGGALTLGPGFAAALVFSASAHAWLLECI